MEPQVWPPQLIDFFGLSTKHRTGTVNWIKVSQLDASSSNVLLSWNPIQ